MGHYVLFLGKTLAVSLFQLPSMNGHSETCHTLHYYTFLYEKFLSVLSFHWFTVLLSVQVSNSVPSMDKRDTIANSMLVLIITLQTGKGFLCANEVTLTTKKEH